MDSQKFMVKWLLVTNNTNIENLGAAIVQQLQEYGNVLQEKIEVESKEVAQDLVKVLKGGNTPKFTGDYRKGWRVKKAKNKYIVHNKTDYQLTHLLEHGHAKRGGGRVAAKVHIRPAEENAIADFLERIKQAVEE